MLLQQLVLIDKSYIMSASTLALLNFLNGLVHLPFLELSIINFRDNKMYNNYYNLPANSIESISMTNYDKKVTQIRAILHRNSSEIKQFTGNQSIVITRLSPENSVSDSLKSPEVFRGVIITINIEYECSFTLNCIFSI